MTKKKPTKQLRLFSPPERQWLINTISDIRTYTAGISKDGRVVRKKLTLLTDLALLFIAGDVISSTFRRLVTHEETEFESYDFLGEVQEKSPILREIILNFRVLNPEVNASHFENDSQATKH
jgi:hypothetical protein